MSRFFVVFVLFADKGEFGKGFPEIRKFFYSKTQVLKGFIVTAKSEQGFGLVIFDESRAVLFRDGREGFEGFSRVLCLELRDAFLDNHSGIIRILHEKRVERFHGFITEVVLAQGFCEGKQKGNAVRTGFACVSEEGDGVDRFAIQIPESALKPQVFRKSVLSRYVRKLFRGSDAGFFVAGGYRLQHGQIGCHCSGFRRQYISFRLDFYPLQHSASGEITAVVRDRPGKAICFCRCSSTCGGGSKPVCRAGAA